MLANQIKHVVLSVFTSDKPSNLTFWFRHCIFLTQCDFLGHMGKVEEEGRGAGQEQLVLRSLTKAAVNRLEALSLNLEPERHPVTLHLLIRIVS